MLVQFRWLFAITILSLGFICRSNAGLVVSRAELDSVVFGLNGVDGPFFSLIPPPNPFINSHTASYAGTTVTTSYNFSWDEQASTGTFQIDFDHDAIANSEQPHTRSAGFIFFTSDVDLRVRIEGSATYQLGPYTDVGISASAVNNLPPYQAYAGDSEVVADFSDPPQGSMSIFDEGVVPADCQCKLRYTFDAYTSVSSNLPYGGQGTILFTVQPVPEPSSLGLVSVLFCAMPLLSPARGPRAARLRFSPSSRC